MTFPLSTETIAEIAGWNADPGLMKTLRANVAANWPLVEQALAARQLYSDLTAVAAVGTVAVETGGFAPVKEQGGPEYLADLYEGRADLGNTQVGDGARFRGRGFVQITGRWDYAHFGQEIGKDLLASPDLALDPRVAADILAIFFRDRGVKPFAEAENWKLVRRRVNGGLAGWDRFIAVVTKLLAALRATPDYSTAPGSAQISKGESP